MMGVGKAGSARPRIKPGDMDRFMSWLEFMSVDKATKSYAKEVHEATLAHDAARKGCEMASAETKRIGEEALQAKEDATRARQALADETALARTEFGQRETAVAERERLATECETSQDARDKELTRREEHLKKAGVRGF